MRRKDREISSLDKIIEIILKCEVCRLGLSVDNQPYIVPLNFGYEVANGKLVLYFHGANAGKKLEMIQQNPNACFEMDCDHQLYEREQAHEFSFEYASVIGYGRIHFLSETEEREHALQRIMHHYTGRADYDMKQSIVSKLAIFKLEVSEVTGKRNAKMDV
ncbi:MAG: pyridoxamine 5-phosphate oxidase family protein [Bacillales bacterium]|jgi:nitroimidazol reductase NimA-like FMN-containing flavoprotein (pyridoxamine 5'-phosphate oxidase superfamily)|nr:pyridoxamine 5-phosphate oxidase family protein [Bacillales bacterium]